MLQMCFPQLDPRAVQTHASACGCGFASREFDSCRSGSPSALWFHLPEQLSCCVGQLQHPAAKVHSKTVLNAGCPFSSARHPRSPNPIRPDCPRALMPLQASVALARAWPWLQMPWVCRRAWRPGSAALPLLGVAVVVLVQAPPSALALPAEPPEPWRPPCPLPKPGLSLSQSSCRRPPRTSGCRPGSPPRT